MKPHEMQMAADALYAAERDRSQVGLLSAAHEGITLEDAYRIQNRLIARKLSDGRRIVGWKIGLTSKAMQRALDIDTPDSGVLFDDMLFEPGSTVPKGRFIEPRIEAEIAFVMRDRLDDPDPSRQDVLNAVECAAPALEILDTRIVRSDPETGRRRTVHDTVADNAANAGLVLGKERHKPDAIDFRRVGVIVERDGEVEETGMGAGVCNDPVSAVIWLASILASNERSIRPGDIILSGSFIRPIEACPGSRFLADFGEFGQLAIEFA